METVNVDLPRDTKERVIEKLKSYQCVLDSQTPIGKGSLGYVYRARRVGGSDLLAVKVVLISTTRVERSALFNSIDREVILNK